jgi:hypothetical protein
VLAVVEQLGVRVLGAFGEGEVPVGNLGIAEAEFDQPARQGIAGERGAARRASSGLGRPELRGSRGEAALAKGGPAGRAGDGEHRGGRQKMAVVEKRGHERGIGRQKHELRLFFGRLAVPGSGDLLRAARP